MVKINEYLSSYILVILLVTVGLWYSIKTRFVQIRCFGEGMKKVFGNLSLRGDKQKSGMSSFQALATAIAAQVGTGNIGGAFGAILTGGPVSNDLVWELTRKIVKRLHNQFPNSLTLRQSDFNIGYLKPALFIWYFFSIFGIMKSGKYQQHSYLKYFILAGGESYVVQKK